MFAEATILDGVKEVAAAIHGAKRGGGGRDSWRE
jgi:hypothetical protein